MMFEYFPRAVIDYRKLKVTYHCGLESYPEYNQWEPMWGQPFSIHLRNGICMKDHIMTYKGRLVSFKPPIHDRWTKEKMTEYIRPFKKDEVEHIPGTIVVFNTCFSDGYGHWISEVIPCFAIANMLGLDDFKYYIDMGRTDNAFKAGTLARMGIPIDTVVDWTHFPCDSPCFLSPKIIDSQYHPLVSADHVYYIRKTRYSWWARDFVTNTFKDMAQPTRTNRRLYFSRQADARRHILNEQDVVRCLDKYGFEIIYTYNLFTDYADQVRLFREADVVVTQRSSILYNLWYCKPDFKLLVLWQNNENKYPGIVEKFQNVRSIDCVPTPSKDHPEDGNCDDITVDIDILQQKLTEIFG